VRLVALGYVGVNSSVLISLLHTQQDALTQYKDVETALSASVFVVRWGSAVV
jgi:hypothetical protein